MAILEYNGARERHPLRRCAVLPPSESPWHRLHAYGTDGDFLEIVGMTRDCFRELVRALFTPEECLPQEGPGRRRSLDPVGETGLLLIYLGSTMTLKYICLIFGIVPSVASATIRQMLSRCCRKLGQHPFSKVELPNEEKMQEYAELVRALSIAMIFARIPWARAVLESGLGVPVGFFPLIASFSTNCRFRSSWSRSVGSWLAAWYCTATRFHPSAPIGINCSTTSISTSFL